MFAKRTRDGWRTSSWNFDETLTSENADGGERDTVWLKGSLDMDGPMTLHDALNGSHALEAMRLYCDFTSSGNIKEAQGIGAGGIIVNSGFDEILFLPRELYRTSIFERNLREATEEHGQYLNRALSGEAGIRFMQAVVIYKALSGSYPFNAEDEEERQNDIRDANYLPLRFVCPSVNLKLDLFVRLALKGRSIIIDREKFSALLEAMAAEPAKYVSYAFTAAPALASPAGAAPAARGLPGSAVAVGMRGSDAGFLERKARFIKFTQTRVGVTRWVRFHTFFIACVLFAVAAVVGVSFYYYNSTLRIRTTTGLDHVEAAQMFYSSQNLLDTDAIRNCLTRGASHVANRFAITMIGGRISSMANPTETYLPPALWFAFGRTTHNVYGLSQFTINGEAKSVFLRGPRKGDKASPILEEDGVPLHNGDTRELTAEYYLWYSVGGQTLFVIKTEQDVTLTYQRNRWVISDIEDIGNFDHQVRQYDFDTFKADYRQAYTDGSPEGIRAALEALRAKYDFLPTEPEIDEGLAYYYETYYNTGNLLR